MSARSSSSLLVVALTLHVGCARTVVKTRPVDAYVYKSGVLVGRTPLEVPAPDEGDAPLRYDVYAPGYEPMSLYVERSELISTTAKKKHDIDLFWSVVPAGGVASDAISKQRQPIVISLRPELAQTAEPESNAEALWTILSAIDAAHRGDCATVRSLDLEWSADGDFRKTVLQRETSLRPCLTSLVHAEPSP